MAEGILRHDGGQRFDVHSAGTNPGTVRPEAIQVMNEIGIDISAHRSRSVDEFLGQDFDYVITVCDRAKQQCPVFPGAEPIHWGFDDPADAPPDSLPKAFARTAVLSKPFGQESLIAAVAALVERPAGVHRLRK